MLFLKKTLKNSYTQTQFTNRWDLENRGTQTEEMDRYTIQVPRSTQTISVVAKSVETSIEFDLFKNSENTSSNKIDSMESVVKCSIEMATQTDFDFKVSNFQLQPIVQPKSQYLLPHLISSTLFAVAGTSDFKKY